MDILMHNPVVQVVVVVLPPMREVHQTNQILLGQPLTVMLVNLVALIRVKVVVVLVAHLLSLVVRKVVRVALVMNLVDLYLLVQPLLMLLPMALMVAGTAAEVAEVLGLGIM